MNCSAPRTPANGLISLTTLAAAVLMAMPVASQSAQIYKTDGFGRLSTLSSAFGWQKTWHQVVPGSFSGTSRTDLLLYDRIHGNAKFLWSDGKTLKLLKSHSNWRKDWDLIVAGNFGGSGAYSDLLCYSASTGKARFYTTDGYGNIKLLKEHNGWQQWDIIVPGNFNATGRSDLFLYSRTRGEGKFFSTDGNGNIKLLSHYTALNKSWDNIVPGRFNSDTLTDLFFYKRVAGEAKLYTVSRTSKITLLKQYGGLRKTWDVVVPGWFSGRSAGDLFFYDRTAGQGRTVSIASNGTMSLGLVVGMPKTWFTLVPGNFDNIGFSEILGYENTVRVRVHAVQCQDNDGSRSTPITSAQVQQWIDMANATYARAGVRFEFNPNSDFETVRDTWLNTVDACKHFPSEAICNAYKSKASTWAKRYPCKIVVFFRTGYKRKSGSGFSSETANYIVMPGFNRTWSKEYYQSAQNPRHGKSVQNIKLLAHELGHYLGLDHTFVGIDYSKFSSPHAAVLAYLKARNSTKLSTLDGDRGGVLDTPPDVGIDYFLKSNWNPANLSTVISIKSTAQKVDLKFSPDRHNVMNYFGICDGYLRVSPGQIRKVRQVLHTAKSKLLDACAHSVTGWFKPYGLGCAGTARRTPLLAASGAAAVGKSIKTTLTHVVPNAFATLMLGVVQRQTSLAGIGLSGCTLLTEPTWQVPMTTGRAGAATVLTTVPNVRSLVGQRLYAQAWVADAGTRTPTKVVTTNGMQILLGGSR